MQMKVIGVQRARIFSPNSVDRDLLILQAVMDLTGGKIVREEELKQEDFNGCSLVLSMARSDKALRILEEAENKGVRVVNSPEGIRNCERRQLDCTLRENGFHVPPVDGNNGWWLKRGDASAQTKDDVVYCADADALADAYDSFQRRGIDNIVRQAHVKGDVLKFYGVEPSRFFYAYYPGDGGYSKFGSEKVNGIPRHFNFDKDALQDEVEKISRFTHVPIFGGDAIIAPDGSYYIIDFNDWPSFSACRLEAARAIGLMCK